MKSRSLLPILACLTLSTHALADNSLTVGTGYQYGGVLGAQYSANNGKNRFFGSLGLFGAALGYQRIIGQSNHHTVGAMFGSEVLTSEKGFVSLTYNYYTQGVNNSGWVFGLSAGARREDSGSFFAATDDSETEGYAWFNVGYRF
ncbi:hypothetical protein L1285_04790 [Pseudoalteromonas sp. DL2-H2.2]|uniref:hypothetical protein n=1 Tax=Pseudoalteromonas sp. DL2-H2.2 TaxID=2908889 RepID=UPI001F169BD0|nr:hypothetical protein [Pseudoalteromonas sp. DL2-H2.2]MCF2907636.1 hypothetical protein [Pseudoalteromonas sp. DL2-H2.2]